MKNAPYRNVNIWYPNSSNEDLQQCLSIDRLHHGTSIFAPLRCRQRRSFIWLEAVVHCQKEVLQIAEVKTMSQAQSLALFMIRARLISYG